MTYYECYKSKAVEYFESNNGSVIISTALKSTSNNMPNFECNQTVT